MNQEVVSRNIAPVPLEQAYLLINHGPATLVSARHDGMENVMAASWVCGLDTAPPKLTAVLGKESKTRELAENSGYFVIQVPTAAQLNLVHQVGHRSMFNDPDKLQHCGVGENAENGKNRTFSLEPSG